MENIGSTWEDSNQKRDRLKQELKETYTSFISAYKIAEKDNSAILGFDKKIKILTDQITDLERKEEELRKENDQIDQEYKNSKLGKESLLDIVIDKRVDKYGELLDIRNTLIDLYIQEESLFKEMRAVYGDLEGSQAIFDSEDKKLNDIIKQIKELDSWKS